MNEFQQIIQNRITSSPSVIKTLIASGRWSTVVKEIAKKNNFSQEQTSSLLNETLFVLIGLEASQNFQDNVKNSLLIPNILARDIADEVVERVFKEVQDYLPKPVTAAPATPTQTPIPPQQTETQQKVLPVQQTVGIPLKTEGVNIPQNLPTERQSLDILQKQSTVPVTSLEKILAENPGKGDDVIILDRNYKGQDPYREPV